MKDILDQEIKIGDLIAYTTIIGRSANMGLYEVATSEAETLVQHYKRGDIYVNSSFVTYLTPDGEVVFKRKEGVVYPRKAILYKN